MKNSKENVSYVSVENAAAAIKSGDTIWVGNTTGISNAFLEALAERQSELKDVTILANKGNEPCKILDELKYRDSFHVLSFFGDALVQAYKKGENEDKIKFLMSGSNAGTELICKQFGVNTIALGVCPPDDDGRCSLGKSGASITLAFNKNKGIAKRIAIIDENIPSATEKKSDNTLSLLQFDYVCRGDRAEGSAIENNDYLKELVG